MAQRGSRKVDEDGEVILEADPGSGDEGSEMADLGPAANVVSEQSRPPRPWPYGAFFPGDGEAFVAPQYLSASSIQVNVPLAPTPDSLGRFSARTPPSAGFSGTAWYQNVTRVPIPPRVYGAPQGSDLIPPQGGWRVIPPIPSQTAVPVTSMSTVTLEEVESDTLVDENGEEVSRVTVGDVPLEKVTGARIAAGGGSQFEGFGVKTRSQTKQQKGDTDTTPVGKDGRQQNISGTAEASATVKTVYSASREEFSGNSTPVNSEEPPWQSEADRLLSQISYDQRYDSEGDVDQKELSKQLGSRLDRAAELIEALVKKKHKLNDKNGDQESKIKYLENETASLAITRQILEEDLVKFRNQAAMQESRCDQLQAELKKAEQSHTVIETARKQQDKQYSRLYDQFRTTSEEKDRMDEKNKILRERLVVYCPSVANIQSPFDPDRPPLDNKIFRMVKATLKKSGAVPARPSTPPAASWEPNVSAAPFSMPTLPTQPQFPTVPCSTPSGLASTQQTTDATPQPQPPPPQWWGVSTGNAPKLPKPRTFSVHTGGNCYMEFKRWIAEVKSYMVLTKVDPDLWAECVVYYLEGFARARMWKELQYFKDRKERAMTFDEFCTFMTDKVIPPRNPALAGAQLEKIQYRPGTETLAAFKDKILDNLQTQKGDCPLGDTDFESAKGIFLNKLPDPYRIFIYRQKWVMENPTLDNYQKAAEMFEAPNDLGHRDGRSWNENFSDFRTGNRTRFSPPVPNRFYRSRSRSGNWNNGRQKNTRTSTYNRRPAGRSPAQFQRSRTPSPSRDQAPAQYTQPDRFGSRPSTPTVTSSAATGSVQCYTCRKWGHMSKDCPNRNRISSVESGASGGSKPPNRRTRINTVQAEIVTNKDWKLEENEGSDSTETDFEDLVITDNLVYANTIPSFCRANLVYTIDREFKPCASEKFQTCGVDVIDDLGPTTWEEAAVKAESCVPSEMTKFVVLSQDEEETEERKKREVPKLKVKWSEEVEVIDEDGKIRKETLLDDGKFFMAEEVILPGNKHPGVGGDVNFCENFCDHQNQNQNQRNDQLHHSSQMMDSRKRRMSDEESRGERERRRQREAEQKRSKGIKKRTPTKKEREKKEPFRWPKTSSSHPLPKTLSTPTSKQVEVQERMDESGPSKSTSKLSNTAEEGGSLSLVEESTVTLETDKPEEFGDPNLDQFWEGEVANIDINFNMIARNFGKVFAPFHRSVDFTFEREPLVANTPMTYQEIDQITEELQNSPDFDKQTKDYLIKLIPENRIKEFPAEDRDMAWHRYLTFMYRRLTRYFIGTRMYLRYYQQENPKASQVHAEDYLYKLSPTARINAVPIKPEETDQDVVFETLDTWEESSEEQESQVSEVAGEESIEELEYVEAPPPSELANSYKPILPKDDVRPIPTPGQEIAGIHCPAVCDTVSLPRRRIGGMMIRDGTENYLRPMDYDLSMKFQVMWKFMERGWKLMIPKPDHNLPLKLWDLSEFFEFQRDDQGLITSSTERFPGATVLVELHAFGWDMTNFMTIMTCPNFLFLPKEEIASFVRQLDFILFMVRLTHSREDILDTLQENEFLYIPKFPTQLDFRRMYSLLEWLPTILVAPSDLQEFPGYSITAYNRTEFEITFEVQRRLDRHTWDLCPAQLPIGRRRRDASDNITPLPPSTHIITAVTVKDQPHWEKLAVVAKKLVQAMQEAPRDTGPQPAVQPSFPGGIGRGQAYAIVGPGTLDPKYQHFQELFQKRSETIPKYDRFTDMIQSFQYAEPVKAIVSLTRLLYLSTRNITNKDDVVKDVYPYIVQLVRLSRKIAEQKDKEKFDPKQTVIQAYDIVRSARVLENFGPRGALETWLAISLVDLAPNIKENIILTAATRRAVDVANRIHYYWTHKTIVDQPTEVEKQDQMVYKERVHKLTRRWNGDTVPMAKNQDRESRGLVREFDNIFPPEMNRLVLRPPTPDNEVFTPTGLKVDGEYIRHLGWKRKESKSPERRGRKVHHASGIGCGSQTPPPPPTPLHRPSRHLSRESQRRTPTAGSERHRHSAAPAAWRPRVSAYHWSRDSSQRSTSSIKSTHPVRPSKSYPSAHKKVVKRAVPRHAFRSKIAIKWFRQPTDAQSYRPTSIRSAGIPPTNQLMLRGEEKKVYYFTKAIIVENKREWIPDDKDKGDGQDKFFSGPQSLQPTEETKQRVLATIQRRASKVTPPTPRLDLPERRSYTDSEINFSVQEARKFFKWAEDDWAQYCSEQARGSRQVMIFTRSAQDVSTVVHYDFEYLRDANVLNGSNITTSFGHSIRAAQNRQRHETETYDWQCIDQTQYDAQRVAHMVFTRFVDHTLVPPRRLIIDNIAGLRWAVDRICDYQPLIGPPRKYPVIIVVDIEGIEPQPDEFNDDRFRCTVRRQHFYQTHPFEAGKKGSSQPDISKMEEKKKWGYLNWRHEIKSQFPVVPFVPLAHTFARTLQMQCPDGLQLIFDLCKLARNQYDPKKFAYFCEPGSDIIRKGEWADMENLPEQFTPQSNPELREILHVPDSVKSTMPTELMELLLNIRTFHQRDLHGAVYQRAPILFVFHNHSQDAVKLYNLTGITMCRMPLQHYISHWKEEIGRRTMLIMDMEEFLISSGYHRDFSVKGTDLDKKPAWRRTIGSKDILAYVTENTRHGERVPYIQERQCGAFFYDRTKYSANPVVTEYVQGRPERGLHNSEELPASATTTGGSRMNITKAFLVPDLTQLTYEVHQYLFEDAHGTWMTLLFVSCRRNQDQGDADKLISSAFIKNCKLVGEMIRKAMASPMAAYHVEPQLLNTGQASRYQAFATEWQPKIESAATAAFKDWRESGWQPSHIPHYWPGITAQLALSIRNHCYIANDPDGEIMVKQVCINQANEWWQNRMNNEITRHVKLLIINGVGLPGIQYRATPFVEKQNPHFICDRFPTFGRYYPRFLARPGAQIRTDADVQIQFLAEESARLLQSGRPAAASEAFESLSRMVSDMKLTSLGGGETDPELIAEEEYKVMCGMFWSTAAKGVKELPYRVYTPEQLLDVNDRYLAPLVEAEGLEGDAYMTNYVRFPQEIPKG